MHERAAHEDGGISELLDPASSTFGVDVERLVGGMIRHDASEAAHWAEAARVLLAGLIVHEVRATRTIGDDNNE